MRHLTTKANAQPVLELLWRIDNGYIPTTEELQGLDKIQTADFSVLELTSLPESIGKLSHLTKLYVSYNHLVRLPDSIGNLTRLTVLTLFGNQLTSLPETIGNLTRITMLGLSHNRLTSLPDSIRNLRQLSSLDIECNNFIELPEWLGDMQSLICLGLSGLKLQEVPSWIRNLLNLEQLYLDDNPLSVLPEWLGDMLELSTLSLENLHLTELPRTLLKLKVPFFTDPQFGGKGYLSGIDLRNTELSIQPVSLFDQSRDKSPDFQESRKLIEDYFNAPKISIREAKVIFLGDGKVGKTYTIQRLLNNCRKGNYPTKETHGILIEDLHTEKDGKSYKVRVWDFGGQDIMHEMHRCFLTDRTCYVIMVDTRSDNQTGRARYWLRTVQSIAPKAPVLLLVNEISGGRNRDLDYSSLKWDFPNLVDVKYCSSLDASDEEFRQKVENSIFEQALRLDSCKMELPESWELVHQNLLKQKNSDAYYIDRRAFHHLCDQYKVPSDDGLRAWLLTWFNDLGVCFSYHLGENGREQDNDYKILNPMWLTSAVYKIIWEKDRTDDGLISLSEIYRILEKPGSDAMKKDGIPCLENVSYNKQECGYVLDIMRMFRISYPADPYTEFMPTLCKTDSKLDPTPHTWKQHAAIQFRYIFLPESVLHRLMIYCFANLRPGKRWRKGFWLESEAQGLSAVIRDAGKGSEENVLQIDVYAQQEQFEAWTWLQPLCQQIIKINQELSLKADTFVLAENEQEKKWFSMDSVWFWKQQGASDMQGERSFFPIQPLLTLIYGRYYPDVEKDLLNMRDVHLISAHSKVLPQIITEKIAERSGLDLSKPFDENKTFGEILKELKRSNVLNEQVAAALELQTIATQQNTMAAKKNTSALQQNTLTLQQSIDILLSVQDGSVTLPREVITALAEEFRKSENPVLQDAGQEMKGRFWKKKGQLLRDLLGDSANIATIAPVVIKLGSTYGPILLELIKTLPTG